MWILTKGRLCILIVPVILASFTSSSHASMTAPTTAPSTEIVVPFEYLPPSIPYPIVALRINGHAPLPFLIDTGTNDFVIQPWAVAALELTPKTVTSSADGSIQQQIPVLKARLEDASRTHHLDVSVGDARVLNAPVLNTAVSGRRLAGIVSFGFLAWSVFRMDFAAKTLTIFPPSETLIIAPGAARIPLSLTSEALPALPLPSDAQSPDPIILDTGTLGSQISSSAAKKLVGASQTDYAFTERGSALYITPELRVDDLMLGSLKIADASFVVLPPDVTPSLGLSILSRYRVTVDAPHQQCFFEPSHGLAVTSAPSGIVLMKDKGDWQIDSIDPASPASKAGLLKGDTILAVDGQDVDGKAKHGIQTLLYGLVGTRAQVTVQRASGAVQNVTFLRAAFTPSVLSPLTGLMLEVIQSGPLIALDVPATCPAYLAGLRGDDRIIAVNGDGIASMDFGQIADALDAPKLTFSVTRKGVSDLITVMVPETVAKP